MVVCKYCNREFCRYQALMVHIHNKHRDIWNDIVLKRVESKKFKCKYCDECFETKCGLGIHIGSQHKNEKLHDHIKDNQFICNRCNKRFKEYQLLRRHVSRVHKINGTVFYVEYYLNGEWPLCKCGCKIRVKWSYQFKKFRTYVQGHQSRIHNNWGHNSEANKKAHITQNRMIANGELFAWNKGLTKETDNRVKKYSDKLRANPNLSKIRSESLKGIKKSAEQRKRLAEMSKINFEKQLIGTSKLEIYFKENFLDILNINVKHCFRPKGLHGFFDFKIIDRNILIEVDGDFWHCNVERGYIPKYEYQINNIEKDKIKNQWCVDNNYILLRFWEYDIKNNKEYVINKLKEILY